MPNCHSISSPTILEVHSAKVNWSCNGFFEVIVSYSHLSFLPSSLDFLPPRFLASSAPQPPLRYRANQLYIAARVTPKAWATTSGLSPCCTLDTARLRSSVNVL